MRLRLRLISALVVGCSTLVLCIAFLSLQTYATQIVVDGTPIQDAINASQPGDTIVIKEGVYAECLAINKNVSLVGLGDVRLLGDGLHHTWENYTGICVLNASVSIRNITVEGFTAGIFLFNSTGSLVQNISATNNAYGVLVRYSTNTTIEDGIFEHNNKSVYGYGAPFTRIENCTFESNVDGIWLEGASGGAVITNSRIVNNTNAVRVYGSVNNTVANNKVSNNSCGLYLSSSPQANITGNIISNNTKGVQVASSQNVSLTSNNIINNAEYGLSSNTNVTLENNYFVDSPLGGAAANASLNATAAQAKLDLFSPVIDTFFPTQTSMFMDENMSLRFDVTASDGDGDPLTYGWYIDGTLVGSGGSYAFTTDYSSAGAYNLTATVSGAEKIAYKNWSIVVRNVNRAPYVVSRSPGSQVAVNEATPLTFVVDARDPDTDILTHRWYIDGNQTQEGGGAMGYYSTVSATERHNITVVVSDGEDAVNVTWNLTVNNINAMPVAFIDSVTENDDKTFTLAGSGTDQDGIVVEYLWWYAGGTLSNTSTVNVSLPAGSHIVYFKVRDNDGNWSEEKSVSVSAADGTSVGAANLVNNIYIMGGVAVTGVMVGIVWLIRRKKWHA